MTHKPSEDEIIEVVAAQIEPGTKIVFAPSTEADKLEPWVKRVVEALGSPGAWISDESIVCDFWFGEDHHEKAHGLSVELGVPVSCGDYIHDVARRLRDSSVH